jgi:hypothetical protein
MTSFSIPFSFAGFPVCFFIACRLVAFGLDMGCDSSKRFGFELSESHQHAR